MRIVLALLLVFIVTGCATRTRQTDRLVKGHPTLPLESHIPQVPFIEQKENHCGPATLAMVLGHKGRKVRASELAGAMMVKDLPGTFQADMLLMTRRQGMQTIMLTRLEHILTEVSHGHPVIVFQNLGLESLPQWHYAVVTGYDLKGPDIILHTGPQSHKKVDMRFFERSWILGDHWALLVLPPDQLSHTGNEIDHVRAITFLESLKDYSSARIGYETILRKWPESLLGHIGLGNVHYHQGQKKKALLNLEAAVKFHPESSTAWHNLATVQSELGLSEKAQKSSLRAKELSAVSSPSGKK